MREIYERVELIIASLGKLLDKDEGFLFVKRLYDQLGAHSIDELGPPNMVCGDELGHLGIYQPIWATFHKTFYKPYSFRVLVYRRCFKPAAVFPVRYLRFVLRCDIRCRGIITSNPLW
jgi:hypothetical protein